MFYEVFIPSSGTDGFDVTITVEADNWMTALKSGLERTGQGADSIRNVMCDIKEDNTIHVTDASTARVFILREVAENEVAGTDAAPPAVESTPEEIEDPDFKTQKMEPIKPLTGTAPVLKSRTDFEDYSSREPTLPRHRPTRPPPGAPPPEATGKFDRVDPPTKGPQAGGPPPRSTSPSGQHAPPPGAAPPPVARQTGQNPSATPPSAPPPAAAAPRPAAAPPQVDTASSTTMPLTPAPAAAAAAAPAAPAVEPEPEPAIVVEAELLAETPPPPGPASAPAPEPVPAATPEPAAAAAEPVSQEEPSDPFMDIPMEGGLQERSWTSDDGRMRIGSSTMKALQREEPEAKVVFETRAPSGQRPAVDIGRPSESVSENALEEVFLEINQIHEGSMSMEQVINFVMDLAMSKIRAEAGSIMFADVNGRELYFATARGPKAHEVMDFRVPMTKGLVGFCAREGVSLAISDAEKDPRFYAEISVKLGYETRNLCCAPIQFEGRVYGAIELMNKTSAFSNTEVNVLTYIGRQLAKFVNDLIMAREKI